MKPRRRRERKVQKRQRGWRDNESRIEAIKKKTQEELNKFAGIFEASKLQKQKEAEEIAAKQQKEIQERLAQEASSERLKKKEEEQRKSLKKAEKNVDHYKKMGYTELRKTAKELGISIYRRKKDDILSEVLKKVTQENNDAEDTHQPLGTEDMV